MNSAIQNWLYNYFNWKVTPDSQELPGEPIKNFINWEPTYNNKVLEISIIMHFSNECVNTWILNEMEQLATKLWTRHGLSRQKGTYQRGTDKGMFKMLMLLFLLKTLLRDHSFKLSRWWVKWINYNSKTSDKWTLKFRNNKDIKVNHLSKSPRYVYFSLFRISVFWAGACTK